MSTTLVCYCANKCIFCVVHGLCLMLFVCCIIIVYDVCATAEKKREELA